MSPLRGFVFRRVLFQGLAALATCLGPSGAGTRPGGAKACSQGRKALVAVPKNPQAPEGRHRRHAKTSKFLAK